MLPIEQTFRDHLRCGAAARLSSFLWVEVMLGIDPPFPFQPEFSRMFGVEIILDLESHVARKLLRAFPDNEMMIGRFHHLLRDQRWRAHPFDTGDTAGALLWAMHATGVELHH